ncbi:MAG: hypothetical protein LBR61_03690 [Synergistaceae bacterium]|nr:hypothetical protein [Synergistaceae bacterium]
MRGKFTGGSLVEVLTSLCILGFALPVCLEALGMLFLLGLRINGYADRAFGVDWWFNRLERPVTLSSLEAMPRRGPSGKLHFQWEARVGDNGAVAVTLYVSDGLKWAGPLVESRVY